MSLPNYFDENRVDTLDPVQTIVHLACPRLDFTDRGKSALDLPDEIEDALSKAITSVAKSWKSLKRKADKENRVSQQAEEHYRKMLKQGELSIKDAAYNVMERAYMKASASNTLPANARQIMYAARPLVLELTGGKSWKKSSYFTQTLLPNFIDENPDTTSGWDVVFDVRGHLIEPHTSYRLGLGTLEVRRYIASWGAFVPDAFDFRGFDVSTRGPENRYEFALFLEKEGFNELLEATRIAKKYDIAIMSTKGMSVTAARRLIEELSKAGVKILVAHDFDKSGFSILHTMQNDTRRYQFETVPEVFDLGLRLTDVERMDLKSERISYPDKKDPRENLRESGATEEECNFLVRGKDYGDRAWYGERVELNAMDSAQLIAWLESKFKDYGVKKVVPDQTFLEESYRQALFTAHLQKRLPELQREIKAKCVDVPFPNDFEGCVGEMIAGTGSSWNEAIWEMACKAVRIETKYDAEVNP